MTHNFNRSRDRTCSESDHPAWLVVTILAVVVSFSALIGFAALDRHDEHVTHITESQK